MSSAVEEVMRQLVARRGGAGTGDAWRVVVDWDLAAVGQFFGDVNAGTDIRHVFVRTGLGEKAREPWFALVEAIVGRDSVMMEGGAVVDVQDRHGKEVVEGALARMGRVAAAGGVGSVLPIPEEISTAEGMSTARAEFVKLGELERKAIPEYDRRFSRLAGGCRPVVVVFDDYNNYVEKVDGVFCVSRRRCAEGGRGGDFEGYLKCHCATLNNLGIVFSVEAPAVRMADRPGEVYAAVSEVLPFDLLDGCRDEIGAFVVDLEWRLSSGGAHDAGGHAGGVGRPDGGGSGTGGVVESRSAGLAALRLVTARYPEVPAFVYTGQWSERGLLEGLVHGASWCFQKRRSHHPPYIGKEGKALRSVSLEEHLTRAVEWRCGAYGDPPDREQLRLDRSPAGEELRDQLGIGALARGGGAGAELQRLVASLFPGASTVEPERMVGGGRSRGVLGTFVVKIGRSRGGTARRFVKVTSWPAVVGEWTGWRRVIEPRLSSHVAQIVGGPVMVEGAGLRQGGGRELKGALAYGLVGFPESGQLRSLGDRLRDSSVDDLEKVKGDVSDTCERVLRGLYGGCRPVVRSVWSWLGDVLPPVLTGVLVRLGGAAGPRESREGRWIARGSRWGVADRREEADGASDTVEFVERWKATDGTSTPWRYPEDRVVSLEGFEFREAGTREGGQSFGYLTVRHPVLGFRIRLRGEQRDVQNRFGGAWVKPGIPVHVSAVLDGESSEHGELRQALERVASGAGFTSAGALLEEPRRQRGVVVDPLEFFGYCSDDIRLQWGIEALEGPIHGDLNLENLMFSNGDGPAWLVDFESAAERGMVAFDLAKLEVEIWNHEVLPLLGHDCTSQDDALRVLCEILGVVDSKALAGGGPVLETEYDGRHRARLNRLLAIVGAVRAFLIGLGATEEEARWARSAYAFASLKFLMRDRRHVPEGKIDPFLLAYAAASWHLSGVAPGMEGGNDPFGTVGRGQAESDMSRHRASFVLAGEKKCWEPAMVRRAAGTSIEWGDGAPRQRWDVVSTGGTGDLTELIGHLWLVGRALGDRREIAVPKIAGWRECVGLAEVLESEKYQFASDRDWVRAECTESGHSVARMDDVIPDLDALLKKGRVVGAMGNDGLTYLSVMSGLVAAGCTHAVVDVKEIAEGNGGGWLAGRVGRRLRSFLEKIGTKAAEQEGHGWLVQTVQELGALQEVRWCSTNGGFPQGRAMGGLLTLLHVGGLVGGSYGSGIEESLLFHDGRESSNQYARFYCGTLPDLCGVPSRQRNQTTLEKAWGTLRRMMVAGDHGEASRSSRAIFKGAAKWMAEFERGSTECSHDLREWDPDLKVYSVGAFPYCPGSSDRGAQVVAGYNMSRFDRLFRWLSRRERNPAGGALGESAPVGVWLHALPGESWRPGSPLVSVVYRPAWTSDRVVAERLKYLLEDGAVSLEGSAG